MSVKDNINMAIMDRNSQFYIMDTLKEIKNASAMQEKLNIKVSYWSQLTQSLSGGNQQKNSNRQVVVYEARGFNFR